jgi:hypothetical protein
MASIKSCEVGMEVLLEAEPAEYMAESGVAPAWPVAEAAAETTGEGGIHWVNPVVSACDGRYKRQIKNLA